MGHKVLFVDDEPRVLAALTRSLRKEPFEIVTANSAEEALRFMRSETVDVVVSDQQMPGMKGADFLALVSRKYPDTVRIMLTGQATMETAIRAINEGEIYRFLMKPCNEVDLAVTIRQALQQKELLAQSRRLLRTLRRQSAVIERLEEENPGITRVRRDEEGAILMDDLPRDVDEFLKELGCEVNRAARCLD